MNLENASLVAQLIDSMQAAAREMEKAVVKNDPEKFKKTKEEILKFQQEISDLI